MKMDWRDVGIRASCQIKRKRKKKKKKKRRGRSERRRRKPTLFSYT